MAGWIRTVGSANSVRNRSPEGTTARGGSSRSFRNPAKSCGVRRDSVHRWIAGSPAEPRALDAEATSRPHGVRRQVAVATNSERYIQRTGSSYHRQGGSSFKCVEHAYCRRAHTD
jgi:hypothetical protein